MAARGGPLSRSTGGCLGIIILGAIIVAGGPITALIVGGLMMLAGFSQIGDRRRDPFSAFGLMAFGSILCVVGLGMWASKNAPKAGPQENVASQAPAEAKPRENVTSVPKDAVEVEERAEAAKAQAPAEAEAENARQSEDEAAKEKVRQEAEARLREQQEIEALRPKLQQNLRLGKALEKINSRGALSYYQEIIDRTKSISSKPPEVEEAQSRIKALQRPK